MIAGTFDKILDTKETHYACHMCNKIGTVSFYVETTYFHMMFIPTLSTGKEVFSTCSNCNKTYTLKNMPPEFQLDAKEFKRKTKIPIWYYSLLITHYHNCRYAHSICLYLLFYKS